MYLEGLLDKHMSPISGLKAETGSSAVPKGTLAEEVKNSPPEVPSIDTRREKSRLLLSLVGHNGTSKEKSQGAQEVRLHFGSYPVLHHQIIENCFEKHHLPALCAQHNRPSLMTYQFYQRGLL